MNTKNNTGKKVSEELEANRLSLYIILAFVCLVGLVYLYRAVDSVHYISFFNRCVQWIIWLSAALVALSLWRVAASRGKDVSGKLLTPGTGLFLSVLALLSGLFLKMYYNDAIKLLYILIPGLCVVYLIKLIYANGFYPVAGFVLVCLRCRKNDGELRLGGRSRRLFKKAESYVPAFLAGAAVVVVGGVFVKSPSYAVFYGLMGLGGLVVALGMYYTYHLMYH